MDAPATIGNIRSIPINFARAPASGSATATTSPQQPQHQQPGEPSYDDMKESPPINSILSEPSVTMSASQFDSSSLEDFSSLSYSAMVASLSASVAALSIPAELDDSDIQEHNNTENGEPTIAADPTS